MVAVLIVGIAEKEHVQRLDEVLVACSGLFGFGADCAAGERKAEPFPVRGFIH